MLLFAVMMLIGISYNMASYYAIMASILIIYILYSFMFKSSPMKHLGRNLLLLLIGSYFSIHIYVYGLVETFDEVTSIIIGGIFVYLFFKLIINASPEDLKEAVKEYQQAVKNAELKTMDEEISDYEYKRSRIKTSNSILDEITGSSLSDSELERNRRQYDRMTDELDNMKYKRKQREDQD